MTLNPYKTNTTLTANYLDKEYIASNRWVCESSPTGAHHWVVYGNVQECRICGKKVNLDVYKSSSKLYNR